MFIWASVLILNGYRDTAVWFSIPNSVRFLFVGLGEERSLRKKYEYTRRIALSNFGFCSQNKETWRSTQANNALSSHTIILVMFEGKFNFLDRLSGNARIWNFTNVRPSVQWGTIRSLGTDRRTDPTKILVAFRHFANAPTNKMMPKVVRLQKPRDLQLVKRVLAQRRYWLAT